MKKLGFIVGLGAMLALAVPLGACTPGEVAQAATSVTSTSNTQQHTLAAAQSAYTILAQAATVYVQTAHPSAAIKVQIGSYNDQIHDALVAARDANAKGNSPAVAAGIQVLRTKVGALSGYLVGLGVPIPALPAIQ